jgi:hypothetical protein
MVKQLITQCNAKGPKRFLWGRPVHLTCMLSKHHEGPNNDPSLTGYAIFWYKIPAKD